MNINHLPDEVIVRILYLLPLSDRKTSRLVCKHWCNLSYDLQAIKSDVTVIREYEQLIEYITPNVSHIARLRIYVPNAVVRISAPFWAKYGKYIISVVIVFRSLCPRQDFVKDVFDNCPKLQDLTLVTKGYEYPNLCQCSGDIIINSSKLLSLTVVNNRCRIMFSVLTNGSRSLKKLAIRSGFNDNFLVTQIINFLKLHGSHLEELSILEVNGDYENYQIDVVKHLGPKLTNLNVCDVNVDCLNKIAEKFVNLKMMTFPPFNANDDLSNKCLISFLSSLNYLTHVSMHSVTYFSIESAAAFARLSNLTCLDLTDVSHITDDCLFVMFASKPNPKILDLRLKGLYSLTDCSILAIAPNLPNLRVLYLNGCTELTDLSLQALFEHNRSLECLSLEGCTKLSSLSIGLSVNALKRLKFLNICDFFLYQLLDFERTMPLLNVIQSICLKNLRALHLDQEFFSRIPVKLRALKLLFVQCPSLQYIVYGVIRTVKTYPEHTVKALSRNFQEENVYVWNEHTWCEAPCLTRS